MDNLKPCPFCNKTDKVRFYTESMVQHGKLLWINYGVMCKRCRFETPAYTKKATAIRKWNTRPAEDALTENLKLFRQTLAEVAKMAIDSEQERIYEKCRDVLRDVYLEEVFKEKFDEILHGKDTNVGNKESEVDNG